MTSSAALKSDPAPIVACTISRDVQNFDLLIEDMEAELGEKWGDLTFADSLSFLGQPEAKKLEFVAVALGADDDGELGVVGEIIKVCKDKGVKVILIAEDLGPAALHQLLRMGADDFCPYPLPEGALHEAIHRVRTARTAAPSGAAPGSSDADQSTFYAGANREGVVMAVHGMAGGLGATTFATNLAWELSLIGRNPENPKDKSVPARVCLLDFDLQYGSVATYLDLPRKEAVYELLSDTSGLTPDGLMSALQVFNENLYVLTAPNDMLPLDLVAPTDIGAVIEAARRIFDFVVIDMPRTVVPWTETVLTASHVYFALIELDMRSAQNTLRFVRALKAEELPFEKLRYVLNHAPKFTDLTGKSRVKRMSESLDIKIELQLPDGGTQIAETNDHGQPLAELAPKNPFRKEIMKLAASMHALAEIEAAGSN